MRGYTVNARSGDNGYRVSVENRITVIQNKKQQPYLQIIPFVEFGKVWNVADNPTQLPPQTFLVTTGLAAVWEPHEYLQLRIDYGYPLIDLEDRGNNLQDDGVYLRFNFRY